MSMAKFPDVKETGYEAEGLAAICIEFPSELLEAIEAEHLMQSIMDRQVMHINSENFYVSDTVIHQQSDTHAAYTLVLSNGRFIHSEVHRIDNTVVELSVGSDKEESKKGKRFFKSYRPNAN